LTRTLPEQENTRLSIFWLISHRVNGRRSSASFGHVEHIPGFRATPGLQYRLTTNRAELIRSILTIDPSTATDRAPFVGCWAGHCTAPSTETPRVTLIILGSKAATFRAISIAQLIALLLALRAIVSFRIGHCDGCILDSGNSHRSSETRGPFPSVIFLAQTIPPRPAPAAAA
jgi:hypothetical protein